MENPTDFQFPPDQTQHNPGPINAGHKASTLPKTENTMRHSVAGGAIVKAKAHIPDLNVRLVRMSPLQSSVRQVKGFMWPHEEASQPFMEGTEASFNLGEFQSEWGP